MLDDVAIHIDHPQRPIRPGSRHHGPKPLILRGKKFALLFLCCAGRGERCTGWLENKMMNEVVDRLADEGVLGSIAPEEQIVAIDRHAAGAGEMIDVLEGVKPLLRF